MNKRGIILLSTLFALFALSFGVLGVRALTLGPDPAQPTETQLIARTVAANQLERQIQAARADVPPALPPVPERVQAVASTGAGSTGGAVMATPAQAATPAPAAQARGTYYEDDDEGHEYEGEHDDD